MNIVLSPHIDDAVFSCWHALVPSETQVYNIFAEIPPADTTTLWDRLCGMPDSRQMMHNRRQENDLIFNNLRVPVQYLPFLDGQYRRDKLNPADIASEIIGRSTGRPSFLAPLAGSTVWRHKDHVLVRSAAILLIKQGYKVTFFPDIPYMYMPAIMQPKHLDRLAERMSKLLGIGLKAEVIRLDRQQILAKTRAMKAYGTQWTMTNLASFGTLAVMSDRNYEICLAQA